MTSTRLWGLLLALALGGCALTSATRYEPAGSDGGYSELQLGPDLFRVAFQGNPYTSQERVADMALLRAADLALAHGASYFVVVQQLRESRSFPTPPFTPFPYTSYGYGYWGPPNPGIVVRDIAPNWRSGSCADSRSRATRPIRPRCFARNSAAGTRWTGSDVVGSPAGPRPSRPSSRRASG